MRSLRLLASIALLGLVGCTHAVVPPPPPLPPPPLPTSLPAGTVGKAYSHVLGAVPANYSVSGTLPSGLSLATTSGELVLSGTPKVAGIYSFSIGQ
jgi:hypothetical protein